MASKLITAIGLMSGTSADGVDAALLRTDGESRIEFLGGLTVSYDAVIRSRLPEASQHDMSTNELLQLERDVTLIHADAVKKTLRGIPCRECQSPNDWLSWTHHSPHP